MLLSEYSHRDEAESLCPGAVGHTERERGGGRADIQCHPSTSRTARVSSICSCLCVCSAGARSTPHQNRASASPCLRISTTLSCQHCRTVRQCLPAVTVATGPGRGTAGRESDWAGQCPMLVISLSGSFILLTLLPLK